MGFNIRQEQENAYYYEPASEDNFMAELDALIQFELTQDEEEDNGHGYNLPFLSDDLQMMDAIDARNQELFPSDYDPYSVYYNIIDEDYVSDDDEH